MRSLVALVASMLATHGVGALHEQIGADMAGGLGEILPVPPALQSEIVLLALTFASSVIVSFLVFRLSTPRPAPRGRSALYTLAFALVLAAPAAAYAEVPEHNPGLDHTCPPGFQYSRGPIACKQADCPAGAGRTYTYDCSCGEAWDRPFRTCRDASGLAVRCVPSDQECDDTAAKIGGGFFIGVGGFILRSTMHAAVAGTGPIGWGLVFGGAAVGYGVYLWTRGRPRRLDIGARITREILERVTRSSRVAVEALNARMRAGLSEDELQDLQVVYEKYINLSGREREQMREELAREGVDTVKLGEAIRWYRSLPPGQQ